MKKMKWLFGLLALMVMPLCAQVLNIGYGETDVINSTFGDTIRIDSARSIRQKISGAFIIDSTTAIQISLSSKGRHTNLDIVELVFSQKILSATNGGDSVQIKFNIDYCWETYCVSSSQYVDSTYRVTPTITSIKDTLNNVISVRVPRSATSLKLYPRITGMVVCKACRAVILPKFVRGR